MATIQGVYVALFGRPADPTGLAYFNSVTKNGADLNGIGDLASTQEYKDRFAGQSNLQIVTSIYQSLFNRDPEAAGLNFFTDALNKGTLSIKNIAIAILDGAQGSDKTIVTNKVTAADNFTKALDTPIEIAAYTGNAAAAQGRAFLAPVNASATSIPSAAATDAAIVALTSVATGGVTLTIDNTTTAQGDVSPTATDSKLKTTGGDDTINVTAASTTQKIDGGLGVDTLSYKNITGAKTIAGTVETLTFTVAADTVTNVEKLVLGGTATANTPAGANTNGNFVVDLTNVKGLTSITDDAMVTTGYTGLKVSNIAASVIDLAVNGKVGGVEFAYGADAPTSNTLTLKAATDVAGTGNAAVTITGGSDTLKLATSGNSLINLTDAAVKTITVSGSGTLGFTDNVANTALTKFDASALSGKLTANFSAATKALTVTGTNNADAITLSGGALKDTVVYNKTDASTFATVETITNFHAGASAAAVEDKIDFKSFGFTNTGIKAITSATLPVGTTYNDATNHSVAVYSDGTDAWVFADSNGNGVIDQGTDFAVKLVGVTNVNQLFAENFVLSA